MLAFGNPKYGVLSRLKASQRNSRFRPSLKRGKTLATPRSTLTSPGPYILFRLQVPKRGTVGVAGLGLSATGTENCAGLNQKGPAPPVSFRVVGAEPFGQSASAVAPNPPVWKALLLLPAKIVNGRPVWKDDTRLTRQPPTTAAKGPSCAHARPLPNGRS